MPSPFGPFASSPEPNDENTHLQEQDLLDDLSDEFFDCDEPPIREEDALRRREALHEEEALRDMEEADVFDDESSTEWEVTRPSTIFDGKPRRRSLLDSEIRA